jgi:hypothetical protein
MAFAITNVTNPFTAIAWEPAYTVQKADITNVSTTQTAVDTGSAVYKACRFIFYGKTIGTLTTGDVITITVQVGTGAAVTNPQNIINKQITALSSDVTFCCELFGTAQTTFESYQVTVTTTSNHTLTYDYQIEMA